jgi:hypothetical protein
MKYKKYFKEIEYYLKKEFNVNVILSYDTEDYWMPNFNKILINKNNKWRERYFSLLHESGHVKLDIGDDTTKNMKMSIEYSENLKSKQDIVSNLNEEILAWTLGKNLAIHLNHEFDTGKYNKIKTNCIMSYIKNGLHEVYGKKIDISVIKT